MKDLFQGKLVRLTSEEPDFISKHHARWRRDSEYHRLLDSAPAQFFSEKKIKEWTEKENENGFKPERYFFSIRTLEDDKLIGFLNMWVNLPHREMWVGLGIGERDYWNKGYGTDMMLLCLQYAFTELNVYRVSLGLFEYNPRALKSYQKAGFRLEGRTRGDAMREGKRIDSLWMGILREEWIQQQGEAQ